MPRATVGDRQVAHFGLLTHSKNSFRNHFINARMTQSWYPQAGFVLGPNDAASAVRMSDSSCASSYMRCNGRAPRASSSRPGFSHFKGVLDRPISMWRNRNPFWSAGGVGTLGRFLSDEYAGGGSGALDGCGVVGGCGAAREGGGGGVCVATSVAGCCGRGGGDCTSTSVGNREREHGRLREPLRLNSFMRLVERVRRNCSVRSAAQFSGNSPSARRCGTGFRRGTPLLSAMPSARVSSGVGVV